MDLPTGNFFEVTINSNKLFSFIEDIFKQLKTQETQIESLSSKINGMVTSVQKQTKTQAYSFDIELQKMRKSMQQEVNYMRLFMRDVDKKTTERLSQVDNTILLLKDMIVKTKAQLQDDMAIKYSYLDKKISHMPQLQEQHQKLSKEIQDIKIKMSDFKDQFKGYSSQQQNKLKKIAQTLQFIMDKVNQTQLDLKQETENITSMRNSFMAEESSRSRRKQKSKQNHNQQESFSNIITKIQEVQSKLTQENLNSGFGASVNVHNPRRSIISNNKIVRSGTNLNPYPKSGFAKKENHHNKFSTFQSAVIQKLSRLQATSLQKLDLFQKQLFKFSNKAEIVDEHIGILSRKLEKQKFKIQETAEQVKRFQERKIDERAIENVKAMIKKLAKDVEESIELKADKETYEKDKAKLHEKLYFLNENLTNKAEKAQVKKGLTFLQQKIRQIIIVLADERGVGQDGAIKKTPFKCLSCDKDLQIQQNQKLCTPIPSNTRCNTQQMRKRIRMINNTISSINPDD